MNEPRKAIMLKRCTSLWNRMSDSRGSPVTEESLAPTCQRKFRPSAFIGSKVSTAPGTKKWVRVMAAYFDFFVWTLLRQPNQCVWGCWCEIGCCKIVHHRGVPRKTPAVLPGNEGKAIGALPVVSKKPSWFFCGRNVEPLEHSPDLVVSRRSSSTHLTRHAVCASGAHCCGTRTNVRFTEIKSKTQSHCDTMSLVAHTETAWRDG